jgi:hypothetical protein
VGKRLPSPAALDRAVVGHISTLRCTGSISPLATASILSAGVGAGVILIHTISGISGLPARLAAPRPALLEDRFILSTQVSAVLVGAVLTRITME